MVADPPPRIGWLFKLGGATTHRRAGRISHKRATRLNPTVAQRSGRRAEQQPALPLGQVRRDQREGRCQHLIQVHIANLVQPLTPGKVTKRGPLTLRRWGL